MNMLDYQENIYGECECGCPLAPVYFQEQEFNKDMQPTGRTRRAVSHLLCDCCGREYPVDDSFDEPWV